MFGFSFKQKQYESELKDWMQKTVKELLESANAELKKIISIKDLTQEVKNLKEKLVDLEIAKSKKEEEFARREREIEHKLGLHKLQVIQESANAKREAILEVKESNMKLDKERFETQMKFVTDSFNKRADEQNKLMENLISMLPKESIITTRKAR